MTVLPVRLLPLVRRVTGSFWFAPSAMALLAVLLAVITLALDASGATQFLTDIGPPFSFEVEGARSLLSTVAGSIITVASLVFSLTLVALTLAAGNIGSRLLQRYMRKTTIQVTLGIFVATFVYVLMVQSAVGKGLAVPHLSLGVALLLTIVSIFWLIYAFHDLAQSIQVDNAVAELAGDLDARIRKRAVQGSGESHEVPEAQLPLRFSVEAQSDGYLQAIVHRRLVAAAESADAVITVAQQSGHFVLAGEEMARVAMAVPQGEDRTAAVERLIEQIRQSLIQGPRRAQTDDPTFAVHLLVEIAGRALSPGVNDFYTALACIDHLGSALATALRLDLHSGRFADEKGCVRLLSHELTFRMIADSALDPLRQFGCSHPPVLLRILDLLRRLAPLMENPDERAVLRGHGEQLLADARRMVENEADCKRIEAAYRQLTEALAADSAEDEDHSSPA